MKTKLEKFSTADIEYEVKVEYVPKTISLNLKPLPFCLWQQIVAFLSEISDKKDTEAIVSLTLVNDEWVIIPWHQEAQGSLHVKYDESSLENKELMAQIEEENDMPEGSLIKALKKVNCTVHSHNKIGAHQSGDDAEDEMPRNGWHITVGHCNKPSVDLHCRVNVRRSAQFDDDGNKVAESHQEFILASPTIILETPARPKGMSDTVWNCMKEGILKAMKINPKVDVDPEWVKRVVKKSYNYQRTSLAPKSNGYMGYAGINQSFDDLDEYGYTNYTDYKDSDNLLTLIVDEGEKGKFAAATLLKKIADDAIKDIVNDRRLSQESTELLDDIIYEIDTRTNSPEIAKALTILIMGKEDMIKLAVKTKSMPSPVTNRIEVADETLKLIKDLDRSFQKA